MNNKNIKAVVIGSGFGGLAAAIRTQAAGVSTTIFEKRDKPGGRAYVYDIEGFRFDAGPTVITVPQTVRELFELAGKEMDDYVKLVPVSPFYRLFWEDGERFDYSNDEKSLESQFRRISPNDWEGYQRFLEYAEAVYEEGYVRLGEVPFLKIWDMIKVAPQLLALKATSPVYKTVSKYVKNEHLRQALTFNSLLIGGNPFEISSIYTLIHPLEKKFGVHFPLGGTHALVTGLVRLFRDLGGSIECSAEVEEIVTAGSKVKGVRVAGKEYPCDILISNADVHHTYKTLLQNNKAAQSKTRSLERKDFSMSLFVLYFGTNRDFDGIVHHNIFFGPRYKELLDDIFIKGILADDFSIYLHAPCKTDPTLAPEGCHSFYALTPVPNLAISNTNWEIEGKRYAERIINYLDQRYMPGLKQSIVVQKHFTPLEFESELNSYQGAAFGLTPKLTQSAWFRTHNRDDNIPGLYFVGASTHPGAGVPGVIGSAKATFSVIAKDYQLTNERTLS